MALKSYLCCCWALFTQHFYLQCMNNKTSEECHVTKITCLGFRLNHKMRLIASTGYGSII